MMAVRLRGLLRKELIQLLRDRVMLALIIFLYTIEVIVCTYALSYDVRNVPLAVADLDRSAASRALIQRLLEAEAFSPAGLPPSAEAAADWVQSGRARAAVVVPAGFERELRRGGDPAVQLILDGTNANIAAAAHGYVQAIAAGFAAVTSNAGLGRAEAAVVRPIPRVWYNPDQSSTAYMVLSMIALATLMVGVVQPAASIVREKESGTVEQLLVLPIRVGELLLAKTAPTLAIGLIAMFPALLIARAFGVPMRGSLILFLGLTALFLVSAAALGVFVATFTRTLQQALLLAFFGLFPIMFLSGTLGPVEGMPEALQHASLLSPLRHYLDVILGIFLKGLGLRELWPQALALLLFGLVLFAGAAASFRRQLT